MIKQTQGLLTSGVGGLYTIRLTDPDAPLRVLSCRAKGAFRHLEQKPLVGDRVSLRYDTDAPEDTAVIREILPRRCALIRPPMANVTHLFAVVGACHPAPVPETVDKLTAIACHSGIEMVLVITKCDLDMEAAEALASIYRTAGFPVFLTSPTHSEGNRALSDYLAALPSGSIAAFAGASGVGKSTLLNRLFPHLSLSTGEISRRIERGRHTTRRVDLFPIDPADSACDVYLADTPGFSLLDFVRFDFFALEDLLDSFPDLASLRGECRYLDCTHTGEGPAECAISRAVSEGRIAPSRHASYVSLYRILKDKKNRY